MAIVSRFPDAVGCGHFRWTGAVASEEQSKVDFHPKIVIPSLHENAARAASVAGGPADAPRWWGTNCCCPAFLDWQKGVPASRGIQLTNCNKAILTHRQPATLTFL